jgi:hypothetical protein
MNKFTSVCVVCFGAASASFAQWSFSTATSTTSGPYNTSVGLTGNGLSNSVALVQTGLETLTVYHDQQAVATYDNVSIEFMQYPVQYNNGRFDGGPGSVTLSSPGHDNLLTLKWDSGIYESYFGGFGRAIGHSLVAPAGENPLNTSGELASLQGGLSFQELTLGAENVNTKSTGEKSYFQQGFRAVATPEPFTMVGLGLAGSALLLRARRKRP